MSNEERQRTIRRAGTDPAEAEKQEGARLSRERMSREDAEAAAVQEDDEDNRKPMAEGDEDKPRPRR